MDHSTPTRTEQVFGGMPITIESAAKQVQQLEINCAEFGVELLNLASDKRGIVHVIGPELGATQPGKTIVCGDSHTSTHGAFGALAFGIGTTEVGHVLATQCLLQTQAEDAGDQCDRQAAGRASPPRIWCWPSSARSASAAAPATCIEFRGPAIRALIMDERMTVCNMSIEAGARAGMIAPDEVTFEYLKGRPRAPQGADWDKAVADWRTLATDAGAAFDREVDARCRRRSSR